MEWIQKSFVSFFEKYIAWIKTYDPAQINKEIFESYSAEKVTEQLAGLLNFICE